MKVMPTYRELLARARAEIDEISTPEAHALLESGEQPLFVDVRLREEWDEGTCPAPSTCRATTSSRGSRR